MFRSDRTPCSSLTSPGRVYHHQNVLDDILIGDETSTAAALVDADEDVEVEDEQLSERTPLVVGRMLWHTSRHLYVEQLGPLDMFFGLRSLLKRSAITPRSQMPDHGVVTDREYIEVLLRYCRYAEAAYDLLDKPIEGVSLDNVVHGVWKSSVLVPGGWILAFCGCVAPAVAYTV